MQSKATVKPMSLYDSDYQLWLDQTVAQLRSQDFGNLDLENLIEEIESLGKSDKRALSSDLMRLCEHLLKLTKAFRPSDLPRTDSCTLTEDRGIVIPTQGAHKI
jgi:hypothetical protein